MMVYNLNINYYVWAPANLKCDWLAGDMCFLEERIVEKINIIRGPGLELGLEFVLE